MIKYPYSKPEIIKSDISEVVKTLKTGYLTQGDKLNLFENELSNYFGSKYTRVCNSGTAALHLLYHALGLGPDQGLLTTPITFLATANAARMCNAPVIFADVDPDTGLITAETIESAIIKSTIKIKVITVVHLGGRVCDLKEIFKVAKKYDCHLVEDACHAPGAEIRTDKDSYKVGDCKYSIACTFSFHAIKHMTMGEGGCITSNNKKIINNIELYRNHGMQKEKHKLENIPEKNALWYYEMHNLGWNYRADELSCALGLNQLRRLDKNIEKRIKIAKLYYNKLSEIKYVKLPKVEQFDKSNVWHLFSLNIDFVNLEKKRGDIMHSLKSYGIGTQVHYIPLFLQPYYKVNKNYFPNAMKYYLSTLSIPLYPNLKNTDTSYIISKIKKIINN